MSLENRDVQPDPLEGAPQADNQDQEKAKLTPAQLKQVEKGEKTIDQVVAKREQDRQIAETKLNKYITQTDAPLSQSDYLDYQELLRNVDSDEEMEALLEKIDKIPETARKEAADEAEASIELDPEDPKLLKLQKEFDNICDSNRHLIGEKQIDGFKAWFAQQRQEKPTVKHLKLQVQKLEGKGIKDKNGLAPRRDEYNTLRALYKKYNLEPLDSDYIKAEGLSERQHFRKQAEALQDYFGKMKKLGFYSEKIIKTKMQEMLKSKNPVAQVRILSQAVAIGRKESTGFTHLDSTVTIAGVTIRKMSKASKSEYLKYYRDSDFDEREGMVDNWEKLVENEADLSRKLIDIYGDDQESLKIAVKSFSLLSYQDKDAALKKHKKTVEDAESKEELRKQLLQDSVKNHANEAVRKKTFNKKTAKNHIDWFEKTENHKNEKTKKPDDYKALKKHHDIFVSNTPDHKHHNIAAYEHHRDHFKDHLKELKDLRPDMTKSQLKKRQDEFDAWGWKGREKLHDKLEAEITTAEKEAKKDKAIEAELNITEAEKKEAKERSTKMKDLIVLAAEKEAEGTPEAINEMYHELHLFKTANYEEATTDPVFLNLESKFARLRLQSGLKQAAANDDREQEIEAAVRKKAKEENNKVKIEANAVQQINVDQTRKDEQRHNNADTLDRAKAASMAKVQEGTVAAELTEDFYDQQKAKDQSEDTFILEEGTGEQVAETKFDDTSDIRTDVEADKRKIREHSSEINLNKGFRHVNLKDEKGQTIKAEVAEKYQEAENQELNEDLAEQATESIRLRDRVIRPFNAASEQDKAAALRAAEKVRKEAQKEIPKAA